jgi:hypothetical protein
LSGFAERLRGKSWLENWRLRRNPEMRSEPAGEGGQMGEAGRTGGSKVESWSVGGVMDLGAGAGAGTCADAGFGSSCGGGLPSSQEN